jgi:3-isopropylmalate/(R)-2-methylmalate dehydratase small subunit
MVQEGDVLSVDYETGEIVNEITGNTAHARPISPFLMKMLQAGGLIAFGPELDQ